MSKKVNPAAVGIFVVGAVVILLAGLILLGAGELFEKKKSFVIYFRTSANGLDVGSDVLLGGVKVGSVKKMMVQLEAIPEEGVEAEADEGEREKTHEKIIVVVIELSADRVAQISAKQEYATEEILDTRVMEQMIARGLRARLKSKSMLTGTLYVDLDFFPEDPEFDYTYRGTPGPELAGLQQIPSTKNEIERVLESIAKGMETISAMEVDAIVAKINQSVEGLQSTIAKIETKVADLDLKGISDKANSTLANADETFAELKEIFGDEKIKTAIANIDQAATELKDLVAAIDAEAVNEAVVGLDETLAEAGEAVRKANAALTKVELAAANIADNTAPDSAITVRLGRTLGAVEEVSRSIKELTDYLKRNPNSILAGKKRP